MSETSDISASTKDSLGALVEKIRGLSPRGARIVFLNGDFNILHPGHLRLFNFAAECGDFLVVGVNADGMGNTYIEQELRLKNVQLISVVDYAFLLEHPVEDLIAMLRPDVVVKGREHAGDSKSEQAIVESYGGRIVFSSGDMRFSSLDLLHEEISAFKSPTIKKVLDYPDRHKFTFDDLERYIGQMPSLNAVVVGDLIVDRYITCEALGMSREDPTIVVSPLTEDAFVGGAGIVAAHACKLGAQTTFLSVCGDDDVGRFARDKLEDYGVDIQILNDDTRPTTLKQRFRAEGKTLLRVNEFRQHEIRSEICKMMLDHLDSLIDKTDLLIFSDFSYGCLPQPLVEEIIGRCKKRNIPLFADSQVSSQAGDVSRFKGMTLITPTELEARTACRDFSSGLVILTKKLQLQADVPNVILSLGSEGVLVQTMPSPDDPLTTDRLPAFNTLPAGVSGAGDSLLACSALCMTLGANVWEAAYLGAIAAACQVARIGNIPLTSDELVAELRR